MTQKCILLVDDEPNVTSAIRRALIDEDYIIETAQSAQEALDVLKSRPVQLIIADNNMPGMDGTELLSIIHSTYPDIIRIMLTGKASIDAAMKAVNEGSIYRFFTKPWEPMELKQSIKKGLERYDLQTEQKILLSTIKKQKEDLTLLESKFPGITSVERDCDDAVITTEMSSDEIDEIKEWCKQQAMQDEKDKDT